MDEERKRKAEEEIWQELGEQFSGGVTEVVGAREAERQSNNEDEHAEGNVGEDVGEEIKGEGGKDRKREKSCGGKRWK